MYHRKKGKEVNALLTVRELTERASDDEAKTLFPLYESVRYNTDGDTGK